MSAFSGLTDWFDDLRTALAVLTRLPMPHPDAGHAQHPVRAGRVFPLVGALIGGIVGVVYDALLNFTVPDLAAASLALGAGCVLTGAMYERGLAATADQGQTTLGTAGLMALLVAFGAKLGVLTSLPIHGTLATLVTAHTLARMPLPALAAWLPGDDSAEVPAPDVVVASLAFGALIALLLLPFGPALTALIAALLAATGAAWWARRTGARPEDALAAAEQAAEIAVMLTVVAIWSE